MEPRDQPEQEAWQDILKTGFQTSFVPDLVPPGWSNLFSFMLLPQKIVFLRPPTFRFSHLRSVSFPGVCFPPFCTPSPTFPLRAERIARPESFPGLGRKVAGRRMNAPFSIAQENARTGARLGRGGSWGTCIRAPRAALRSTSPPSSCQRPAFGQEGRFRTLWPSLRR